MNVQIGYASGSDFGGLTMWSSLFAGTDLTVDAAAADPAEARGRELAGGVLHRHELELVRQRERDVDVADRALRVGHDAGDDRASRCRPVRRPRGVDADAELGLPRRADLRQVVGEVVGRARVVGSVDRRDRGRRQAHLRVQRLDRRVVPLRDVAEVDVREHRPVMCRLFGTSGEVVDDRRRRERPRDLDAARCTR